MRCPPVTTRNQEQTLETLSWCLRAAARWTFVSSGVEQITSRDEDSHNQQMAHGYTVRTLRPRCKQRRTSHKRGPTSNQRCYGDLILAAHRLFVVSGSRDTEASRPASKLCVQFDDSRNLLIAHKLCVRMEALYGASARTCIQQAPRWELSPEHHSFWQCGG